MPKVSYIHPALTAVTREYMLVRDCLAGETAIKRKRGLYLPAPLNEFDPDVRSVRYNSYIGRAIFYNVARHTLTGMVGNVFSRRPTITDASPKLQPIIDDCTGVGISTTQLAKAALGDAVSVGRCGLFVDYPRTDAPLSQAEVDSGNIRPWMTLFKAENIINWRTAKIGGVNRVVLVVIAEKYPFRDDGFQITYGDQFRVLRLQPGGKNGNGQYVHEIWRGSAVAESTTPKDADGEPFETLPFMFIGPQNNDPDVDPAPMYDLCNLNIGHYRNSADYEESGFLCGQPTPVLSGVTTDWVKQVWQGKEVMLGSRAAIPLPPGGSATLLQAAPNSMVKEAMDMKQDQMVAIGAKLITPKDIQRTATETNYDESATASILSSCAENVGYAFTWGLSWCGAFIGERQTEDKVKFDLNTQFDLVKLTPQERQQLMLEWQNKAITFGEYRASLKRAGIAEIDDDKAETEIQEWFKKHPDTVPTSAVPKLTQNNPADVK